MNLLPSAVQWSHHLLRSHVQQGDWVIDATAGNGHDTLFLAQLVSEHGRVFAFDVQAQALQSTAQRLGALATRCELTHASHHQLLDHLPAAARGKISTVVFNLGYLPGADKNCITQTKTTLIAIDVALTLLRNGGMLMVVVYPGHAGGDLEAAAVAEKLSTLDWQTAEVQHMHFANRRTHSPECWVAVKR